MIEHEKLRLQSDELTALADSMEAEHPSSREEWEAIIEVRTAARCLFSAAGWLARLDRLTVECPECGGTGRIILDTRDLGGDPCPTCNGDGHVIETRLAIVETAAAIPGFRPTRRDTGMNAQRKCGACGGRGYWNKEQPRKGSVRELCPVCGGTGVAASSPEGTPSDDYVELTGDDVSCGRQSWSDVQIGKEDRMPQPDGQPCGGLLVPVAPDLPEGMNDE